LHEEEEDEFVAEDFQHKEDVEDPSQCFMDWNSLPTYDTYVDDEDFIVVSSLSYDKEVENNSVNNVFDESSKSEISQWSLDKINYVDFLGIENFLSNFL